ncbi:SGNH/GDSL hydrolase family protein [Ralstonia sp. ASV6]|uniref:SGNH/GDSL hydrolase family protein n=1 Tax=Ralstonia sp. ASV6 TaxID=2795124 RepID=UPI0018EBCC10|nr:SGNH/GDSL hydrolase family protein [Ralstonia sp. ASV6]
MKLRELLSAASIALTLGLAACGGGSDEGSESKVPNIQRMVVFGDSLSDAGTLTPTAQTVGGGKHTTNPGPIWAEAVASQLGVALTPAVMIDANALVHSCPKPGCFDYAQGGSRVTDSAGPYSIKQQLANFYAASNNTFNGSSDVVFVLAGSNDVFYWAGVAATPGSGVTPAIAMAQVQQAATELVGYIKDMISKNATQLYVLNLPDSSLTPGGTAADAPLVSAFNATLQSGLAGTTARVIDFNAQFAAVIQNGAQFGFSNTTTPACDAAKIDALVPGAGGSSLFCSANTLVAAGADQSYLFADGVHPTTGGHRLIASNVLQRLLADSLMH